MTVTGKTVRPISCLELVIESRMRSEMKEKEPSPPGGVAAPAGKTPNCGRGQAVDKLGDQKAADALVLRRSLIKKHQCTDHLYQPD